MSDTTVGIIIGSGFTILGVVLQGLITWFLNWRSHKMSLREQHEKEVGEMETNVRDKREKAYMDYLVSMGVYLMMIGAIHGGIPCPPPVGFQDGSILKEMAKVLASVQLYGSPKIMAMARGLLGRVNICILSQGTTTDDFQKLDVELQIIAEAMKSELTNATNH